MFTTSWDRTILVYDLKTGDYRKNGPQMLTGHSGSICCSDVNEDGTLLATGGLDNVIMLWDVEKKQHALYLRGHNDSVHGICISTDEKFILSASKDRTLRLWDIESRERLPTGICADEYNNSNKRKCLICEKKYIVMTAAESRGRAKCRFCTLDLEETSIT
ncbi:unnamed protein product [Calicophoron daubneyi]|uniref:Uncharacterized protein n=1 Tax=Calicophoron daubneyi TaxID=300641 RepID=A0AAV2TGD9_CALDB